jgi:hypothetical protein
VQLVSDAEASGATFANAVKAWKRPTAGISETYLPEGGDYALSMRLGVLTTDTTHHTWWVWKLAEAGVLAAVVLEERVLSAAFETHDPFEDDRDAYEREVLLAGCPSRIDGFAPTLRTDTANEGLTVDAVADCDLVVVFGTGLIGEGTIRALDGRLLNLHGGDPERYRGLDTHLWAIYHRDFAGLVTALHEVAPLVDTGAVVSTAPIPLSSGMHLSELRARNSEVCLELTLAAAANPGAPRTAQRETGRYYSFMPSALKKVCVGHFAEHVACL